MKVELHLRQLLFRHDCVVLPGFGAFLLRHKSAVYEAETHAFRPPERQLSFNAQLTESDALLATEISKAEGISFRQGEIEVEEFVQQLKKHLNTDKTVELQGVGTFEVDAHQVVFQSGASDNFLLDSFGLERLSSAPVKRLTASQEEPTEDETSEVRENVPADKERKKTAPYLKYAAIGIAAIGLSGFLGLNWYSSSVEKHNLQAQKEAEKAVEQKIQKATFTIENTLPETELKVDRQKGQYHIIAGAYRSAENADKKVQELRDAGYKARTIGENKYGLHQVAYESYEDRLESLRVLRKIKRQENADAWLFVKKL